jgi:hypothetical protein
MINESDHVREEPKFNVSVDAIVRSIEAAELTLDDYEAVLTVLRQKQDAAVRLERSKIVKDAWVRFVGRSGINYTGTVRSKQVGKITVDTVQGRFQVPIDKIRVVR